MAKLNDATIKRRILQTLERERKPLSADAIASRLRIRSRQRPLFLASLSKLAREGKIERNKRGKFTVLVSRENTVEARILSLSGHFSFARPSEKEELKNDIYLSAYNLMGALPGDTVLIRLDKDDTRGPQGKVVEIVEEGGHLYSGKIVESKDDLRANPIKEIVPDSFFRFNIPLSKREDQSIPANTKVRFNIDYNRGNDIRGTVVTIYGDAGSAKVAADAIIDNAEIPYIFPNEVIKEAERLKDLGISSKEFSKREDLRDSFIITIDGADAKDLDDAISLEKSGDNWVLGVHIADVSHYVKTRGKIDLEAQERGTSVYFADRVIPMLPEALSNGACSLNAGEDKLAMSAMITLDKQGMIKDLNLKKSVIKSSLRGVYSEVNALIGDTADDEIKDKYSKALPMLKDMKELSDVLEQNSRNRGTMEIESTESRFVLDDEGHPIDIFIRKTGESEGIIEQFMITANEAIAEYSGKKKLPFVYRIHESPDGEKLELLSDTVRKLGFKNFKLETQMDMQKLMDESRETPFSLMVSGRLLRSMAKAKYSPDPVGHFGLALKNYCHFTSPIRRYPDLLIHRILGDSISGVASEEIKRIYHNFVSKAADFSSNFEVRAVMAERNCEDCYKAEYISRFMGEEFDGIISSVTRFGLYIKLENSVEGLVRIEKLPETDLHYDDVASYKDNIGKPIYTIGDGMKIIVENADVSTGLIDFGIVKE